MPNSQGKEAATDKSPTLSAPAILLPKGGGAIRGMGEKFGANPVTGTGSLSVPIYTSPGRSGFGPQLSLSYDSGSGNGPFGFGWSLSLPSITRKTDKGLPKYQDAEEADIFILSGAEDLVAAFKANTTQIDEFDRDGYKVRRFRPRIEGLFARIERWTNKQTGELHWRSISRDNVTTLYGKTAQSQIADPADPLRVFSWLICESYDDKGNAIVYEYKEENSDGVDDSQVHEKNRTPAGRSANRYLKRIRYGNRVSRLAQPDLSQTDWMFEAVFDYGEHEPANPKPNDSGKWLCRHDPFSSYRAGFEVRTYRLCQRVLMFHHFPDEEGVGKDCLVRSTDFLYRNSRNNPEDLKKGHPIASFIASITQSGYKRQPNGSYLKKSLPSLQFEYSQATIQDEIREIDTESLENLPYGLDGGRYQWVDLDGEGLSGILTEQADAWFFKPNLGGSRFGPLEKVAVKPSLAALSSGQQLIDLAGDGQLDLVELSGPAPGFYERTHDQHWERFTPLASLPNIPWDNPNLRLADLTGDGHADILIAEGEVFTWYPSLAEEGFGPAEKVPQALDEEKGPQLLFADSTQSVYLADISGDGLTDLVRVRNGEVCYWPNLGYGHFGAKVTMDNAPWFDTPDQFDQRRIRLADIDGSGVTDIIYLGRDGVHLYFNQSGNSWSEARTLTQFPHVDDLSLVTVVDLLGNGTACIVWSSPLPGDVRRPMRYIDLMGGQKPHLLIKTVNNLGAETHVQYASSTKFYLTDRAEGKPWITRLPFPVHVVERVETYDRISRNRFVTRYIYHHGYFDGIEREFRGFGMVEQRDTEEFAALNDSDEFLSATNVDEASHVPPVLTKTWFHTGAYFNGNHISNFFAGGLDSQDRGEYYREPAWLDDDVEAKKHLLDDTVLPSGLTVEEEREACRVLKGSMLRQEVYALDGTGDADYPYGHPYTVTEQNFTIRRVQPRDGNRHAVFFTHARQAINYHYERNPADPRVSHALTLEVDKFGNVLKSLAIGYGRGQADPQLTLPDQKKQTTTLITYTENDVTNAIDNEPDNYRTPLPSETRTYELTGFKPANNEDRFSFDEWVGNDFALLKSATEIKYEQIADPTKKQKRLIERVRTLYRPNDLGASQADPMALLPLGKLEPLALPGESYKLAFTPGLLAQVYKRGQEKLLPNPTAILSGQGGYVDLDQNGNWWIPSGRVFFHQEPNATPAQELAYAQQHFFLPHRFRNPFGKDSLLSYDKDPNNIEYDLLISATQDTLGNEVKAEHDYRVLQPRLLTDPNDNRSEVKFDALGLVAGTVVMGKVNESKGDSLAGFNADLTQQQVDNFFEASDPHLLSGPLLGSASTRIIYDLDRFRGSQEANPTDPTKWEPVLATTLARETHASDPLPPDGLKIQISFSYSDGFGREIQKKIQAEPGPLAEGGPEISPRWVGSGWTIFNNKGKPVRQYEPFFDDTHEFRFAKKAGVSPVLFHDPVERVVATLHPNDTYEKVVFDPWRQEMWDVSDTVLNSDPRQDVDVADFFKRLFGDDPNAYQSWHDQRKDGQLGVHEKDAATKAAAHADTRTVANFDTLGRTFLTIADNGAAGEYETRVELDIEGNQRQVIDAKGRVVMRYDYDMLGNRIHQASMDAGEHWLLNNVASKLVRVWDSRGHTIRTVYDELQRPTHLFVRQGDGPEVLAERTVYGEAQGIANNHRGKVFQVFDGAGVVTNEQYDFKGNLLSSKRQLLQDYKGQVNWLQNLQLENEIFTSSTTYDALNRPTSLTTPDKSVIRPTYNEANLLEKLDVRLRDAQDWTPFVKDIDYNAKGQRESIEYGSGVKTEYKYDEKTFRLINLKTIRPTDNATLQNLTYTYDPVGNITEIRDEAQQMIFFNNAQMAPAMQYTYDAIYRLIQANGREHVGQTSNNLPEHMPQLKPHYDFNDSTRMNLPHPNDWNKMRPYDEKYEYDQVGNILKMIHGAGPTGSWTRRYEYEDSNNRLRSTNLPGDPDNTPLPERYEYDAHGNMTKMPHLPHMQWDFEDQLQMVDLGGGGKAYYVYDTAGQRVRKVVEKNNGALIEERIYVGGFEIFRQRNGNGLKLERETLHVMDEPGFAAETDEDTETKPKREASQPIYGSRRVALVETKTHDEGAVVPSPAPQIRYQLNNHLGSASLELDDDGAVISYEEYHPYGTTSYQAGRNVAEVSLKRYRYTGKERDEESGFYYHGARYYAAWLARWVSADRRHTADGLNLYEFVKSTPINFVDESGEEAVPPHLNWSARYETRDGQVRIHFTVSVKVLNRSLHASRKEIREFMRFAKSEFENTLTKYDEKTGIHYSATLNYEIINELPEDITNHIYVQYVDLDLSRDVQITAQSVRIKKGEASPGIRFAVVDLARTGTNEEIARTLTHELLHTANLRHPWDPENRIEDIQQSNPSADDDTILHNIMNTGGNPDPMLQSSEGTEVTSGQLFLLYMTIQLARIEENVRHTKELLDELRESYRSRRPTEGRVELRAREAVEPERGMPRNPEIRHAIE